MDNTHIDKLRELTDKLPALSMSEIIKKQFANNLIEYEGTSGSVIGLGIYKEEDLAIQKTFLSKGSHVPKHSHLENEWMIVISGYIHFEFNGTVKKIKNGGLVYFNMNEYHAATAIEDTWLLCITIPPSGGYPNANRA